MKRLFWMISFALHMKGGSVYSINHCWWLADHAWDEYILDNGEKDPIKHAQNEIDDIY